MPNSIRPGDVLADRYLLVDLLSESGNGRFWRAHDRILERHVAVHVVADSDERADAMMEAARASAAVQDRRILRVLDVDRRDGLCYVVNEWGSGRSLDTLVATEGPTGARRAAWVVSEVAATIAAAHDAGVAHGRLVPENVLIDHTGSVRVIGFSVDAALLGLPPGRMSSDVADLAGLLYHLLTGKWAGVSRSGVPIAPTEGGRVLRPRRVKAGIPRTLDALCDRVINEYDDGRGEPGTGSLFSAPGIRDTLRDFVGDPAGMAAAEAAASQRNGTGHETRVLPTLPPRGKRAGAPPLDAPTTAVPAQPAAEPPEAAETSPEAEPEPQPEAPVEPEPVVAPRPERVDPPAASTDLPTQAGMPIFDDVTDDVSWLTARADKPTPPPPFEEPPERPLFAPEPADGQPARRPRPGATPSSPSAEYWPWESGTSTGAGTGSGFIPVTEDDEDDDVPGRSWLRLAGVVGACTLLLVAIVFAFNLGRGRSPLGELPEEEQPSATDAPAAAEPISGVTATDFDPQGDPPDENPELAGLAVDGDPATAWRTMTYEQDLGPGGLKTGVGLVLDLGDSREVSAVDLTTVSGPTSVSLYLSDTAPTGVRGLEPLQSGEVRPRDRITLDEPASGRYLVVWLTSLPTIEGGFRGEVAEVVVRG